MKRWTITTGAAAALATLAVFAANTTARAADPKPSEAQVDRTDLAAAYLRLEHVWFANPPTDARQTAEANRTFDSATRAFFQGNYSQAVESINGITAALEAKELSSGEQLANSLAATCEPPVLILDDPAAVKVRVRSLYPVDGLDAGTATITLRLRDTAGSVALEQPLVVALGDGKLVDTTLELSEQIRQAAPAVYTVELGVGDQRGVAAGRLVVVPKSLDALAEQFAKRLAAIDGAEELAHGKAICQARVGLLSDRPSPERSAQFLGDPIALVAQLQTELAQIEAGENPYRRMIGDHWRIVEGGKDGIPLRIYAPKAAGDDAPLPLLIAMHGAGGDENMFLEAYGVGVIKRLADEHGLIVASPSTYSFGGKQENFDRLLASLAHDYAIDKSRVYLIGHSMGAGATIRLASARPDQIAAACCLAGNGRFKRVKKLPPLLMVFAELDGIIAAAPASENADAGIEQGLPIEKRMLPNFGHTLMVGTALPDAVAWLVARQATADEAQ
jgi:predicted esterase